MRIRSLPILVALANLLGVEPSGAEPGCIEIRWWYGYWATTYTCPDRTGIPAGGSRTFQCEGLASPGCSVGTNEWLAQTGLPVPAGCYLPGAAPGPAVADTCDADKEELESRAASRQRTILHHGERAAFAIFPSRR